MSALPWIDPDHLWFPPAEEALTEPDGLLALGGDLAPERIVLAYRSGIFPWYSDDQPVLWWSPDPRCVLFPGDIHISRSLRRTLNKGNFSITSDQSFRRVIRLCGSTRPEGTWITDEMESAYNELHRLGVAHSIEAWSAAGDLVGGLYGLAIGRCFFAESMFSLETNASRVLMVHLAHQLQLSGYRVVDCQVASGHLIRMGATTIPRQQFLSILQDSVNQQPDKLPWTMDWRWNKKEVSV